MKIQNWEGQNFASNCLSFKNEEKSVQNIAMDWAYDSNGTANPTCAEYCVQTIAQKSAETRII